MRFGHLKLINPIYKNYFIDANIIISYHIEIRKDLVDFINDSDNRFYFTESVMKTLEESKFFDLFKSLFQSYNKETQFPSKRFTYIQTNIKDDTKEEVFNLFYKSWMKSLRSKVSKKSETKDYTGFSPKQFENLRNDFLMIVESNYVRNNLAIYPFLEEDANKNELKLLVNNSRLLKKFEQKGDMKEALELSIILLGLEHLIKITFIDEIIEEWEKF
jgi:hypothetical protein